MITFPDSKTDRRANLLFVDKTDVPGYTPNAPQVTMSGETDVVFTLQDEKRDWQDTEDIIGWQYEAGELVLVVVN